MNDAITAFGIGGLLILLGFLALMIYALSQADSS